MSGQTLRSKVIRLAHANPEILPHLLPLLTKTAAVEFNVRGKHMSHAPTAKMAARPRKPLTLEQVSAMGAAEINKWRDVLDKESSGITDELIAAGRGNERPTETVRMTDPLALRYIQNWKDTGLLRDEIARRYGPGAPSRLPRGFGPIKVSRLNTKDHDHDQ